MSKLIYNRIVFSIILLLIIVSITSMYVYSLINHEQYRILFSKNNIFISKPIIDGNFTDWLQFSTKLKLHPDVFINGFINDWYTEYYYLESDRVTRNRLDIISNNTMVINESNNFYLYYKGEFVWFDKIGDVRTGFENNYSIDLTEFRVTGDNNSLYILVRVRDLGIVGDPGFPTLLLSIPIDIDMNPFNGNITTIDEFTNVSTHALWDYQIVIDLTNPSVKPGKIIYGDGVVMKNNGSPLDILNPQYRDISSNSSLFVCNPATDSIEISIAWRDLGVKNPWNISNVRFYVMTFIGNGYGVPTTSLNGSQVLDVLSSELTDVEVSDQVIDYWIDIGFTIACEPTYYNQYILDDKGFVQAFTDLSSDYRTDYIPNEAFDVDLVTLIIWIDQANNLLHLFIHIKGLVKPLNNVSPAIAIVIDTTPLDYNDGVDSWIHVPPNMVWIPPGKSNINLTETELGVHKNWSTLQRSINWSNILWIVSKLVDNTEQYYIYSYNGVVNYVSNITIRASEHFIEANIPLDKVDPTISRGVFRIEVLTYAYVLESSLMPGIPKNTILDIYGSNIYDVLSPYATYSPSGIELIYGRPYAVKGEIYDTDDNPINDLTTGNGDHWIDTFNTRKYPVKIRDLYLYHRTFDGDTLIEVGEPAWINATIEYFDGSSWIPLVDKYVSFYLLNNETNELISISGNVSDINGSLYLFLDDIASRIKTGYYYLIAIYNPISGDELLYLQTINKTENTYAIFNQPFVKTMNESKYIPLVVLTITILFLLYRRLSIKRNFRN